MIDWRKQRYTLTIEGTITLRGEQIWPDEAYVGGDPPSLDPEGIIQHIREDHADSMVEFIDEWKLGDEIRLTITALDDPDRPVGRWRP